MRFRKGKRDVKVKTSSRSFSIVIIFKRVSFIVIFLIYHLHLSIVNLSIVACSLFHLGPLPFHIFRTICFYFAIPCRLVCKSPKSVDDSKNDTSKAQVRR